jgi:cyanophycinase-like exopeptidase
VLEDVERLLLAGRRPAFVQLATGRCAEGPASLGPLARARSGVGERLGVQQVVVPVVDRISADDEALAGLVEGAGLVYLSGGNPPFLATTLRGTAVWRAIEAAWRGGAALAGCSAGAMALSSHVPDLRHPTRSAEQGLGVVPHLRVLPHFDRFAGRVPDLLLTRIVETRQA